MTATRRVAAVTVGLMCAGAVIGGVSAAIAAAIILAIRGELADSLSPDAWSVPLGVASAGALIGCVAAPIFAWAILRSVPLGRAAAVTAVGTIVGGVVGEFLLPLNRHFHHGVPGVIRGALFGFVIAAIALQIWHRRATSAASHRLNSRDDG